MLAYIVLVVVARSDLLFGKKKKLNEKQIYKQIENIGWSSLSSSKCACFFKALDCVAGWWVCIFKKNWSAMIFTEILPNLIPKENLIEVQHSFFSNLIFFLIFWNFEMNLEIVFQMIFFMGVRKLCPTFLCCKRKKVKRKQTNKNQRNLK